jgi:hypothetical protein
MVKMIGLTGARIEPLSTKAAQTLTGKGIQDSEPWCGKSTIRRRVMLGIFGEVALFLN